MPQVNIGCVETLTKKFRPTIQFWNDGGGDPVATFFADVTFNDEPKCLKFCQAIANLLKQKPVREAFDRFGDADLLIAKEKEDAAIDS